MALPHCAADSFFILPSLCPRRRARTNDPNPFPTFTMGNENHVLLHCIAQSDLPVLVQGVVRSGYVIASGSKKTDDASSKATPCFLKFAAAFRGSHSNVTPANFNPPLSRVPGQETGLLRRRPIRVGPIRPSGKRRQAAIKGMAFTNYAASLISMANSLPSARNAASI